MRPLVSFLLGKRSVIRYGAIGAFSAALDFTLFAALVTQFPAQASSAISVLAGMTCSYILNSKLNFYKKIEGVRAAKFLSVGLLGLATAALLLELMLSITGDPLLSKAATIPAVALLQYTLNSLWTFRESHQP
jgi:putative flippase GtrA